MANSYTDLLQLRMPALGDVGWDDEVNDNQMIADFVLGAILKSNVIISGLAPSDGGGLDVDYIAGTVVVGGTEYSIAAGSKTCTGAVKNWLYVDSSGVVQISTTQPAGNYVAIAMVDAGSSSIDRIADARNFAEGALTIGITYSPNYYSPDTGQSGAINQHLAGIDARLGIMAGFRNKLINGDFNHWQRGISQSASGKLSDDRWHNIFLEDTVTHSRQAFTIGQTDVPGGPKYYSRTVVNSNDTSSCLAYKRQDIESVLTFAGQTATLSFYVKANATKNLSIDFAQFFGTGGSPDATVHGIAKTTVQIGTTWQKITLTANIPSIAGKTLGSNNDDYLWVRFWFDAGSDYDSYSNELGNQSGTFDLARVQLESGEEATFFEVRPLAIELALCQRYYWAANLGTFTHRVYKSGLASGDVALTVQYPQTMRATPTVTYTIEVNDTPSSPTSLQVTADCVTFIRAGGGTLNTMDLTALTADAGL